jgi:ABC-type sulfate transport system substrate-binding protein
MIWALLAAYFLGGGVVGVSGSGLTTENVKQLSEHAVAVIENSDRSRAAQRVLNELGKEVSVFENLFEKSGSKLAKSYQSHAADSDQALVILGNLNSGWEVTQQRALDLRFELRESMTEAEWTELFGGK